MILFIYTFVIVLKSKLFFWFQLTPVSTTVFTLRGLAADVDPDGGISSFDLVVRISAIYSNPKLVSVYYKTKIGKSNFESNHCKVGIE